MQNQTISKYITLAFFLLENLRERLHIKAHSRRARKTPEVKAKDVFGISLVITSFVELFFYLMNMCSAPHLTSAFESLGSAILSAKFDSAFVTRT